MSLEPKLEFVCELQVDLSPIVEIGEGRAGKRRIIPIVGGHVSGPKLSGTVLNVGADWQTIFKGDLAELDTRYAMQTDDGAVIEIRNYGYRHGPKDVITAIAKGEDVPPDQYYMRTHARLETGDERYQWVNQTLFVGAGARKDTSVIISLYAVV